MGGSLIAVGSRLYPGEITGVSPSNPTRFIKVNEVGEGEKASEGHDPRPLPESSKFTLAMVLLI